MPGKQVTKHRGSKGSRGAKPTKKKMIRRSKSATQAVVDAAQAGIDRLTAITREERKSVRRGNALQKSKWAEEKSKWAKSKWALVRSKKTEIINLQYEQEVHDKYHQYKARFHDLV